MSGLISGLAIALIIALISMFWFAFEAEKNQKRIDELESKRSEDILRG